MATCHICGKNEAVATCPRCHRLICPACTRGHLCALCVPPTPGPPPPSPKTPSLGAQIWAALESICDASHKRSQSPAANQLSGCAILALFIFLPLWLLARGCSSPPENPPTTQVEIQPPAPSPPTQPPVYVQPPTPAQEPTAGYGSQWPTGPAADTSGAGEAGSGGKSVYVHGYQRKDGTYVRPHYRSRPGR
jgi:hypothetical protein